MPRATPSIYVSDPSHWNDPTKAASREECLLKPYQAHFGKRIPLNKQYWTMCSHQQGELCEINQLVKTGLLTPSQFHGVDTERTIIASNKELHPEAYWYHGDFVDTIEQAVIAGNFDPAIVNYDGVKMLKYGCPYLKSILMLIDHNVPGEVLLAANFLLNNPYRHSNVRDEAIAIVNKLIELYDFPDHWQIEPKYYWYPGTGQHSNSLMGTLIFVKQAHSALKFTKNRRLDRV